MTTFFRTILTLAAVVSANSVGAVTVFTGFDASNTSGTSSDSSNAFNEWTAATTSFQVDNLDGLLETSSGSGVFTTPLGNRFTTVQGDLDGFFFTATAAAIGPSLELNRRSVPVGEFLWELSTPSNAFGFFGVDNDGATVTIRFSDGEARLYEIEPLDGPNDSFFFGVTGANSLIESVLITAPDIPGQTVWDNFSVGVTDVAIAPVPLPAAGLLLMASLGGLAAFRRRDAIARSSA